MGNILAPMADGSFAGDLGKDIGRAKETSESHTLSVTLHVCIKFLALIRSINAYDL